MIEPSRIQGNYLKDWLIFMICTAIGSAIAGGIVGFILGGVSGITAVASGHGSDAMTMAQQSGRIGGYLASLPVSYFIYRWTVRRIIIRQQTEKSV